MATTNKRDRGGAVNEGLPAAARSESRLRRGRPALLALCAGLICLAVAAASASAHVVNLVVYAGKSIDGVGTTFNNANGTPSSGIFENGEEVPFHFTGFI